MTLDQYRAKWPEAPARSSKRRSSERDWWASNPAKASAKNDRSNARRRAEIHELRKKAWRPDDWWEKPEDWRIIGTMLLDQDYMSNKELAGRLDDARIVECPYDGGTWRKSITLDDCSKFISKIRKWVNRPGRRMASIPLATSA